MSRVPGDRVVAEVVVGAAGANGHDGLDARLADRVVVMNHGVIERASYRTEIRSKLLYGRVTREKNTGC